MYQTAALTQRLSCTRARVVRTVALCCAIWLPWAAWAQANNDVLSAGSRGWWHGEFKDEFHEGTCSVKAEGKNREYKREIKCKDGVGASWRGQWKTEFRDGKCLIKQEAKRDEFKEEVKCSR